MKPKAQPRDSFELFQAHFDPTLDPGHELIQLTRKIDWPALDAAFVDCYRPDIGAPAEAVRLMVGLHSPQSVCEKLPFSSGGAQACSPGRKRRAHQVKPWILIRKTEWGGSRSAEEFIRR